MKWDRFKRTIEPTLTLGKMTGNLAHFDIAKGEKVVCYWKRSMVYVEHRHDKRKDIISVHNDPRIAAAMARDFAEARKRRYERERGR